MKPAQNLSFPAKIVPSPQLRRSRLCSRPHSRSMREALAWRERMVLVRNPAYCSKRSTPSLHIGGRLLRLLLGVIAKHMRQQRAAGRERLGGRTIGGRGNREWGGGTRV